MSEGPIRTMQVLIPGPRGIKGDPGPPLRLQPAVDTVDDLPISGNGENDIRVVKADGHAYQWNGIEWDDLGPFQGPPGELEVELAQGEVIVGTESGPGALALPSYGEELRRKGVQLAWGRAREAYLNDRDDVDATGTDDMAATITAYLDEYQQAGYSAIYLDAGSTYKVMAAAPVDVPKGVTLFGGEATNYFADAAQRAAFVAGASNTTIIRLQGQKASLNGVQINLGRASGYTGVVGVRPNNHWQRITNSYFSNCDATSVGVKGGGILYFEFGHNMFSGGWNGYALDILDAYADNPSAVYYGANVAWYHHNTFAQAIRVEGHCSIYDNDFEGGAGSQWPAIEFQTTAYQITCNIERNYFEMSGNNQGILLGNGARGVVSGNVIEASSAATDSYGIKTGYLHGTAITGNHFGDMETGILISNTTDGAWSSHLMVSNTFSAVTTPVSGGRTGLHTQGTNTTGSRHTDLSMRGDSRITYAGAIVGGTVLVNDTSGTVIDLRQGNLFIIDRATPATLTVANNLPSGQVFHLAFRQGGQTLQNSVWRLLSGSNETPPAGTVKTFVTTSQWSWGVHEAGYMPPPQPAITAEDTTAATGTDATLIENLRDRINELEDALIAHKLLEAPE